MSSDGMGDGFYLTTGTIGVGELYADNIRVDVVPEPSGFGALAFGVAALVLRRRRS